MKVFRMTLDINHYQYFLTKSASESRRLSMDGIPLGNSWSPPAVYVERPKRPAGDFYNPNNSVLIASPRTTEVLRSHFNFAGELLPLPYKDQIFTVLNVTQCVDILDPERSEFATSATPGIRGRLLRPAFHANRFPETSLFKIPDDFGLEIYVLEGANDFDMEFRETIEATGLKGLLFEEIWSDDGTSAELKVPVRAQTAQIHQIEGALQRYVGVATRLHASVDYLARDYRSHSDKPLSPQILEGIRRDLDLYVASKKITPDWSKARNPIREEQRGILATDD